MKLCKHCGAYTADNRAFCVDCGKRLGKPLSSADAERFEAELDEALEQGYQNADELRPTTAEIVWGCVLIAACIGGWIGWFLAPNTDKLSFLLGAIAAPCAIFEVFFAKLSWRIERWRLSWRYELDPDQISLPTRFIVGRKIAIWVFGTIAIACVIFGLIGMAEVQELNNAVMVPKIY